MIKLSPASTRNTPSHWVRMNDLSILFSYQTAMGFSGYLDDSYVCLRRPHHISNTTARHMSESGVRDYPKAETDEEFEEKLERAFLCAIHPKLPHLLTTLQEVAP